MGSSGAGVAYHNYSQLIRHASLHPPERKSGESTPALADNVGRVKWDEFPIRRSERDLDELTITDDSPAANETFFQKTVKIIKILVPHVGLNILLLSYIAFGALVFTFLEADNELQSRKARLKQILKVYKLIMNETGAICRIGGAGIRGNSSAMIERRMRPLLSVLSRTQ
uniref:Uncharacterized protein n=1 Tax=Ditylenchus dipsaci TaxID=166011 RepID=A0A915EI60_9BILA